MPTSPVVRAIDTNIVVRYLTNDDVEQSRRVRKLVDGGGIFVSISVVLESEWVLRAAYRFARSEIVAGLRAFIGLPGVTVEDPASVTAALDWAAAGMDLADAVHLAGARACTAFVSFDRALAKTADRLVTLPVVEP